MLVSTLLLLVIATSVQCIGFTQSAAVQGKLMCHDKPATKVKVKLYDEDFGQSVVDKRIMIGIDLDDLLDEGYTDADGHFSLSGHTDEFGTIDPKFNIYHDCDDGLMPCQRKLTIYVPAKYVAVGETPKEMYDAGVIQLSGKYEGETRDCLHRI